MSENLRNLGNWRRYKQLIHEGLKIKGPIYKQKKHLCMEKTDTGLRCKRKASHFFTRGNFCNLHLHKSNSVAGIYLMLDKIENCGWERHYPNLDSFLDMCWGAGEDART